MMELAIKVMLESVVEPRIDGKPLPKVGAVLVKADGTVQTACRGELRHGDHAEYTLLDKKNRTERLDGSTLYATLEPCRTKSRKHPKLGCAERIVAARIKELYIGTTDPDPKVKGSIEYLQSEGVTVHMFPPDLQKIIETENQKFLEDALRRAAEDEQKPSPQPSTLSKPVDHTSLDDFSREAMEEFRVRAKITDPLGSPAFDRRLARLDILKRDETGFVPTGFGMMLFGEKPRETIREAGLLGTIRHEEGADDIKDFDGPEVFIPEQVIGWLRDKLPHLIDRTSARRRTVDEPLYEIVREGVVNALVHRDYRIQGAKCQLLVTTDLFEIRSPGRPTPPLTLSQLQSFNAPMVSRNPVLHYVFAQMELAEERGFGLKSIRRRAQETGLPLPTYTFEDPYLVLRVYRTANAANELLPENIRNELVEAEMKGWQWLRSQGRAKSSQYAQALGLDERSARRHLNRFVELGLARRSGAAKATFYEAVGSGHVSGSGRR